MKHVILFGLLAAVIAVFFFVGRSESSDAMEAASYQGPPEVVAVTFSSSWCTACKILEPRLASVRPGFADQPIRFLKLDFSFGESDAHQTLLQRYPIAAIYEQYKGATGFTVLVDAQSGAVLEILTTKFPREAMRQAIAQSIAIAQRTDATQ